jgi:hypothetical protein
MADMVYIVVFSVHKASRMSAVTERDGWHAEEVKGILSLEYVSFLSRAAYLLL